MSARDFNSQPQGTHLPAGLVPPSVEEDVRSAIWKQIVLGHADEATLAFDIADQFSDGPAPVDEDGVRAAVHHLLAVRRGQQETFGEVVTNLDSAFATLRERGVIAEQVFSCCNTCVRWSPLGRIRLLPPAGRRGARRDRRDLLVVRDVLEPLQDAHGV